MNRSMACKKWEICLLLYLAFPRPLWELCALQQGLVLSGVPKARLPCPSAGPWVLWWGQGWMSSWWGVIFRRARWGEQPPSMWQCSPCPLQAQQEVGCKLQKFRLGVKVVFPSEKRGLPREPRVWHQRSSEPGWAQWSLNCHRYSWLSLGAKTRWLLEVPPCHIFF